MRSVLAFLLRRGGNDLGAIVSADRALAQYRGGLGRMSRVSRTSAEITA